jgi:hypothetical protein
VGKYSNTYHSISFLIVIVVSLIELLSVLMPEYIFLVEMMLLVESTSKTVEKFVTSSSLKPITAREYA